MKHYLSSFILCASLLMLGSCQSEKTDYVAFLYKYMPTSDSVDYSREYWERQVAMSERARKEMPWAKLVPETEWKHFVVPVRVNNEALDDARTVIYEELAPRIKDMSMEEAALDTRFLVQWKLKTASSFICRKLRVENSSSWTLQ